MHDPLTGLANRFLVQQWLDGALQEHLGRDIGVLYCDLDRLKLVNDSLGHNAGDDGDQQGDEPADRHALAAQ